MADADLLLVVLAALQDPECGVRTFKKSKPLKKARNCFLGSQLVDALRTLGLDETRKAVEIGLRLLDAGLVTVWEGRGAGWADQTVYAFSDYVVMDRAYISDELPAALTFFATTPYEQRSPSSKSPEPLYGPLIAKRRNLTLGSGSSVAAPGAAPARAAAGGTAGDGNRFIEEDGDDIVFMLSGDDPVPVVKAGSAERLVERLTYDKFIDLRFQDRFLLAYRTVIAPTRLLRMLCDRYLMRAVPVPEDSDAHLDEGEWQKRRKLVQLRTLTVLSRWVLTQFEADWAADAMKLALFAFIDEHVAGVYDTLALQIRNNYQRGYEAMLAKQARYEPPSLPELRAAVPLALDDANVEATAQQLTLHEAHLFSLITPTELLSFGWSKRTPEERERSRNVLRVIHFFNTISAWAVAEVVTRLQLRQRVAVLQRFIALASRLRELNNFNGAMAVGAALLSSPIQRLTQTWAELPEASARAAQELAALFSYSHSYRTYRTALRAAPLPCLPYLGLFLTDLTFVEESQADRLESGLLNFAKMAQFARVCTEFQRYQHVPFRLPPNRPLLASLLLIKVPLSGEDEAYEMSLKIEPRNPKESFEQMLISEEKLRAELRQYAVRTADLEAENARLRNELAAFDEQLRAVLRHSHRADAPAAAFTPSSRVSLAKHVRTRLVSQRMPSPLAPPILPEIDKLPSSSSVSSVSSASSASTSTVPPLSANPLGRVAGLRDSNNRPASMSNELLLGLRMPGVGSRDGSAGRRKSIDAPPLPSVPLHLPPDAYSSPSSASPSPPTPLNYSPPPSPSPSVSPSPSASGYTSLPPAGSALSRHRVPTDAAVRPLSPSPLGQPTASIAITASRASAEQQAARLASPPLDDSSGGSRSSSVSNAPLPVLSASGGSSASPSAHGRRVAWWEKEPTRAGPAPAVDESRSSMLAWWEVLRKPDATPSAPPLSVSSPAPASSAVVQSPNFKSSPNISQQQWRPGRP